MMLVYALTITIVTAWIIKMVKNQKLIISRTPLDIPLLLFLLSQVLATIFSIDKHTSIWGYYSRSNGGLLSITSYILLYYAFVSNFSWTDLGRFLKVMLLGGLLVSLWAIPEHFGRSFSCLILQGEFTASCWVQDVQARVFATLGQPNWLAAYLGMIIFIAIYFFMVKEGLKSKIYYFCLILLYYLAFSFTYSRGATLGLIGGFLTLIVSLIVINYDKKLFKKPSKLISYLIKSSLVRKLTLVLFYFLLINFLFASALTSFSLIKQSAAPTRPGLVTNSAPTGTQLENGGTESGQIRLIVWRGAFDIFRNYPVFGSGVETFAYSYFKFRPNEHNLVSEWDFLYNKAHNEYLNYLATTGILGFGSYVAMIGFFIIWVFKFFINKKVSPKDKLLISCFFAGYVSYLIQNIFGFSVVMIALLFYLFPAFTFVGSATTSDLKLKKNHFLLKIADLTLLKRPIYSKVLLIIILVMGVYLLAGVYRYWLADSLFKRGLDLANFGNTGRAYNLILQSTKINQGEPLYKSELGNIAAVNAVSLAKDEATLSAALVEIAQDQTEKALEISPANVSLWRTAIRTYFALSTLDKEFNKKTIEVINYAISLAPNDPKIYHSKGVILDNFGDIKGSISSFEKAVELKPNYHEALFSLGLEYEKDKQIDRAIETMERILKLIPNEPDAAKKLEDLRLKKSQD